MMPTPDELILALLAAQPQHGYQLLEAFRDPARLAYIWDMSAAQIYAVLKRLERAGEILGIVIDSDDAPTRTEFQTTRRGRARLRAWLDEPSPGASIRRVRVDFLSRVYAAKLLGEPLAAIVQHQMDACAAERSRVATSFGVAPSEPAKLALALQLAQIDAVLAWMRQAFDDATEAGDSV